MIIQIILTPFSPVCSALAAVERRVPLRALARRRRMFGVEYPFLVSLLNSEIIFENYKTGREHSDSGSF